MAIVPDRTLLAVSDRSKQQLEAMMDKFMTFVAGWVAAGGEVGVAKTIVDAFNAYTGKQLAMDGDCASVWVMDDERAVAIFDGMDREWSAC